MSGVRVSERLCLFQQTHYDKGAKPSLPYNEENASNELPQLDSGACLDRELTELAEHEAEECHEILCRY